MLETVLSLAAAANAALLAAALGFRAWAKRARAGQYAAAFLAVAAFTISLIALEHAGLSPPTLAPVEASLTAASGPFLVLFIRSLLGLASPPRIALVLFGASVAAGALLLTASAQLLAERLVFLQMAFTAYAAWLALTHMPAGRRSVQARNLALTSVIAMGGVHVAQMVRTLWPHVGAIEDIVPLAASVAFLTASGAVYFGGRVSVLDPILDAPAPPTERDRRLVEALQRLLDGGTMRDASLTLPSAAKAIEAAPEALSHALLSITGLTFLEYLLRQRVAAAQRMLADPGEARTSVEAIGLLVGFGSRSAFYKAFGDTVGVSPAAYRADQAHKHVQNTESGQ